MKQHVGVFGPGQSGKTTLVKAMVKALAKEGFKSMAIDPNGEDWGPDTEVFTNPELFFAEAWKRERMILVIEEATETINRDKGLTSLFTRIRHRGHKLIVVGHSGTNLLPIMREQIHFLHLFRQSPQAAALWAETFADERIMEATTLAQYEFLRCINFGAKNRQHLIEKKTLTMRGK